MPSESTDFPQQRLRRRERAGALCLSLSLSLPLPLPLVDPPVLSMASKTAVCPVADTHVPATVVPATATYARPGWSSSLPLSRSPTLFLSHTPSRWVVTSPDVRSLFALRSSLFALRSSLFAVRLPRSFRDVSLSVVVHGVTCHHHNSSTFFLFTHLESTVEYP